VLSYLSTRFLKSNLPAYLDDDLFTDKTVRSASLKAGLETDR